LTKKVRYNLRDEKRRVGSVGEREENKVNMREKDNEPLKGGNKCWK
jgi:hypothetical protein